MAGLLVVKEHLKVFYGRFEVYIRPVLKFLLALVTLLLINKNIGYMQRLDKPAIVLVVALMCSFLPVNMIIVFAALFIVMHVYTLSMECAVVVLVLLLLMFLLYFRFSPKDTLAVLLTPVSFMCHIPYAMPVCYGFAGSPVSAVSVGCGVIVYYVLDYIKENSTLIGGMDSATTVERFKMIIDDILKNRNMLITATVFAVVLIAVYMIRRLSADHSWTIALVSGTMLDIAAMLVCNARFDMGISAAAIIIGNLVSAAIAVILEFFVFSVDYTRTEYVQFEDDEYYYYVKAVPKVMVNIPSKKIKKISSPQKKEIPKK